MNDPISILSVIIVFTTIFFDLVSKDVESYISIVEDNIPKPDSILNKIKEEYPRLKRKAALLLISFLVLTYLLLPHTFSILKNSHLALWNFDLESTLFVCIEIYLIIFTIMSGSMVFRLISVCKEKTLLIQHYNKAF